MTFSPQSPSHMYYRVVIGLFRQKLAPLSTSVYKHQFIAGILDKVAVFN